MRPVTYLLQCLLFLSACSPSSLSDFQKEGKARNREFAQELSKIEDREQLVKAEFLIKKHFEALVDLMIEAREFQLKHPDDGIDEIADKSLDLELEGELRRIYTIEGGREIIEHAQQEALVRLDAFERNLAKKKRLLVPKKPF